MSVKFRAKFKHERLYDADGNVLPKGGKTTCRLVTGDGELLVETVARCHTSEHYVKRIGRDVSLGRALKELEETYF